MENDGASTGARESAEEPGDRPTRSAVVPLLWVALVVAIDQLTKVWAVHALEDGPIDVVGETVRLRLTRNPGAAFSNFQGYTPLLALLAAGVTVFLVRAVRRETDRWTLAGLVLVLAGALGNLVDRIVRDPGFLSGEVIDFVQVGWWPVFNVADAAITVGAVLLIVRSLRA